MGTHWARNGDAHHTMGTLITQWGRTSHNEDAHHTMGTQWGCTSHNGDAMDTMGTQSGQNGDTRGPNGDAISIVLWGCSGDARGPLEIQF